MCFVLIRGHGKIRAALAGFISLSMVINVTRYAVVRSLFGIRHIRIAAAKPIASAVITAGLMYLLLQPINRGVLASTVFAVFVFSPLFAGSLWFLITMDHDREIISLVFAPTPPIEGGCE
jgi:heme/copper-type cytochrome/quinol oxidase subunit 4